MKTKRTASVLCTILFCLAFSAPAFGAFKWSKIKWPDAEKGIKVYSPIEDQVVLTNGTACFSLVVEPSNTKSPPPLFFQWRKNDINISGANGPSLTISGVQVSDVGFYSCSVRRGSSNGPGIIVRGIDPDAPGAALFVLTDTNTAVSGPIRAGASTKTCVGTYKGWITFKNSAGSTWWSVPTGKTSCTISDLSSTAYSPPYSPVVHAVENTTLNEWCATNTVTFPVVAGRKYQITTYIKNTMPHPTPGDTLSLDITWNP